MMIRSIAALAHDAVKHIRWKADMRREHKQAVLRCVRASVVAKEAEDLACLAHQLTQRGLLLSADHQWALASRYYDDAADLYTEAGALDWADQMEERARECRRMVGTIPTRPGRARVPVYAVGDRVP